MQMSANSQPMIRPNITNNPFFGQQQMMNNQMVPAHFNRQELNILDQMQGGRTNMGNSPIRTYDNLEGIMRNPQVQQAFNNTTQAFAKGGQILDVKRNYEKMKMCGRNGDQDIAFIGPETLKVFKKLLRTIHPKYADGDMINPMTNFHEFWGLSGLLSGAWNAIRGLGSKIIPTLTNAFQGIGGMAKKVIPAISNAAQKAAPYIRQGINTLSDPRVQEGIRGAYNTIRQHGPKEVSSFLERGSNLANDFANSAAGRHAINAATRYGQSGDFNRAAAQTAMDVVGDRDDPFSRGIRRTAKRVDQGYDPYMAAQHGFQKAFNTVSDDPNMNVAKNTAINYIPDQYKRYGTQRFVSNDNPYMAPRLNQRSRAYARTAALPQDETMFGNMYGDYNGDYA